MGAYPRYCFKQPTASLIALGIRFAFKSTWALKPGKIYAIYATDTADLPNDKFEAVFSVYKNLLWTKASVHYRTKEDMPSKQELGYIQVISSTPKQGKKGPNDIYYKIVIKLVTEAIEQQLHDQGRV